jgi:hypothetical protein
MMPRRPSLPRRLRTASRWPVGVVLTSWRYMWRTTPLHRSEVAGRLPDDAPPRIPGGVARDEIQDPSDGAGALFHRVYRARIRETDVAPEELVDAVIGFFRERGVQDVEEFTVVREDVRFMLPKQIRQAMAAAAG